MFNAQCSNLLRLTAPAVKNDKCKTTENPKLKTEDLP